MNHSPAAAGLLLIDKPSGITSFDCIRQLRRQTGVRKMGHAGTLDPMATGLMLILVGAATKQATTLLKLDKTYEAELTLGATSSTGDAEGELTAVSSRQPNAAELQDVLKRFTGHITQVPPAYSAIKIKGQPAYKRIRRGEEVVIPAREVAIHALELIEYRYPRLSFRVHVSSGTYIRSLAADIGTALGSGAYLSALRRTTVGDYNISQAHQLNTIQGPEFNNYLMKLAHS